MKKTFENYLILSDFDGTFAGSINGKSTIIPRNIEAIERFKANGGYFTFSTGRLPSVMSGIYPQFTEIANAPAIMANGAIIYDTVKKEIIEETFFDGIKAREVQKIMFSRFPDLKTTVYTDDGTMQLDRMPDEIVGDKWRKMNFRFPDPDEAILCRDMILSEYNDLYNSFRSYHTITEAVDKTVTKGAKIKKIREFMAKNGCPDLTVICVGDFENDINMLESADIPCCPSNAIEDVKKISRYVLCDHNDGVIADIVELMENNKI